MRQSGLRVLVTFGVYSSQSGREACTSWKGGWGDIALAVVTIPRKDKSERLYAGEAETHTVSCYWIHNKVRYAAHREARLVVGSSIRDDLPRHIGGQWLCRLIHLRRYLRSLVHDFARPVCEAAIKVKYKCRQEIVKKM